MTKIATDIAENGLKHKTAYFIVRNLVTFICRTWCRMTIEGSHNVPAEGIFILAPTHRSIIDTPIASGSTRRRMRFMGADKWWSNKALGGLLTVLGGFPVSRGTADREALRRAIELLESGQPLVLFPEGERKSGPVVQPLFDGACYIALKTGAPIIPVGIGGSERVMPKGAKFIYPRKVHVVIGAPIRVSTEGTQKEQRQAVRDTTEVLHGELQRLFDRAEARCA
jgi:1-acyl-sn-glycerol-3-phosphate acyltransferase